MEEILGFIISEYDNDISENGHFWRITRANTFVDLLMAKSFTIQKREVKEADCIDIILIACKAIYNMENGTLDYNIGFKQLQKKINKEDVEIKSFFIDLVSNSINENKSMRHSSFYNQLNYFKVISNLNLENYSVDVFLDIMNFSIDYLKKIKTDANIKD